MTLLAAAAALGLAGLVYWFSRVAVVGAAYKAKILGSAIFVSGRDLDCERAPEVCADDYRLLRLFRARVDRERREVSASFLGLGRRVVVHRPGLGATLAIGPLAGVRVPAPAPASGGWDRAEEPEALREAVDAAFEEGRPRARRTRAVLVWRDGRLLSERYAPGLSPDAPLPGWSMTKSFFGALVGAAVGEGRLRLEDRGLFEEWKDDARADISLEDLLRMRSGLKFAEVYANPLSDVVQMLYARGDAAGFALRAPLEHPPGSVFRYSSGTSNIVSLLLRRRLGDEAYWAFPRRALLDPLGMARAVLEPDAAGTFVASSYLFATAREWLSFGTLFAEDGARAGRRLLPEGWAAFCASPTPQSDGRYGAHWWLKMPAGLGGGTPAEDALPAGTIHALGHEGQCLTVIPAERLVALRLGLSIRLDGWDHAAFLADVRRALS